MKVYKAECPVYSYKNESERLVSRPELYMKYKERYETERMDYGDPEVKTRREVIKRVERVPGEFEKRAYQQKAAKVQFQTGYTYGEVHPFIFFYKFLAVKPGDEDQQRTGGSKHMRLRMWVPDTVVYNDGDAPFWIYSGVDGLVYRTENFIDKHVVNKLGNSGSPDELVAILKYPEFGDGHAVGNHFQLLNTRELHSNLQRITGMGGTCAIQKFVKCKGPNPFVVRAIWKSEKATSVWVLTGRNSFYDQGTDPNKYVVQPDRLFSTSIISSTGGVHCKETGFYLSNLAKFLHAHTGLQFTEIVGDYLRDEAGVLWFIGIRAFRIKTGPPADLGLFRSETESVHPAKAAARTTEEQRVSRVKVCKFCQLGYRVKEVCHKMTLKMIIQTQMYLKHLGKNFAWMNHGDPRHFDKTTLYQTHLVCSSCFQLFIQIEELRKTEQLFASTLGIPVDEEGPDDFNTGCGQINSEQKSNPAQRAMLEQKREMHPDWEFAGAEGEFTVSSAEAIDATGEQLKNLKLYSVLVIFHHLSEVVSDAFPPGPYFLEYTFFEKPVKFRVPLERTGEVPINKLRIYYFFSKERDGFVQFLNYMGKLEVRLLKEQVCVGSVKYDLSDYKSELVTKREFNSVLSGTLDQQDFTCFLKLTLGISQGVQKNAQNITLRPYQGIYLPKDNYSTCEPLPQEWLELIPENGAALRSRAQSAGRQRSEIRRFDSRESKDETERLFQNLSFGNAKRVKSKKKLVRKSAPKKKRPLKDPEDELLNSKLREVLREQSLDIVLTMDDDQSDVNLGGELRVEVNKISNFEGSGILTVEVLGNKYTDLVEDGNIGFLKDVQYGHPGELEREEIRLTVVKGKEEFFCEIKLAGIGLRGEKMGKFFMNRLEGSGGKNPFITVRVVRR